MGIMSIIKFEFSVPEAMSALEKFKENRLKVLEEMTLQIRSGFTDTINQLLNLEMTLFLGESDQVDNKKNGFKTKDYNVKGIGSIRLKMPQDRNNKFNSAVIPKHERMDPRLKQDLAILHLAGISNRVLAMISKKVLGIKVGKDMVNESIDLLTERALNWLNRPIIKKYWALYVDGTNFRIQRRGSTEKEPSLVVLGIDTDGHRSILAISPGNKDNAASWKSLFKELKERGLSASDVQVGIMDGLPGLENVFKEEFSSAITCRCWVHAMKNAFNKCPARLEVPFKEALNKVMYADSYQDAKSKFEELKISMGNDAMRAIDCISKDLESLLAHYKFEKKFWRSLKTTNPIERINRELKRRTKTMDSVGDKTLCVVVAFIAIKLEYGWSVYTVDDKRHEKLNRLHGKNSIEIETLFN